MVPLENKDPASTVSVTLLVIVLLVSGCISSDDDVVDIGDMETETTFLELGPADNVEVNLDIGIGNLVVRTDSPRLMDATFKYNVDKWKPVVSYVQEGEVWNLTVAQPNTDIKVGEGASNSWNMSFGTYVPMEMNINIGAGNGNVRIYDMNLVSLSVGAGSGNLDVDLSGPWPAHLVARIGTGVGDVKLVVPSDVGVQVVVDQGMGEVVAPGFTHDEETYVNGAFETSEVLLLIAVSVGTGNVYLLEIP